jgi:hypothetical protein
VISVVRDPERVFTVVVRDARDPERVFTEDVKIESVPERDVRLLFVLAILPERVA